MGFSALVTGGAGFIGGHVVRRLVEKHEARVVAIDNFDPFYDSRVKRAHWEEVEAACPDGPRPELLEIDIRDGERLRRLFAERHFDLVIHLAARAGVRPSVADAGGYMDVNVTGTARLFEACREAGVTKVVFVSSSSVYGGSARAPFKEGDPAVGKGDLLSPYAVSKRAGELLTQTFAELNGWRAAAARVFTAYGPWQRPDLAIHRFTRALLDGKPITAYGDGSTSRAYTHVDDVAEGLARAAGWTLGSDAPAFEVVNVGTERAVRLSELIEKLQALAGRKAEIVREPLAACEVASTAADLAHARELLGFEPKVPFDDGLRAFVEWCRRRPGS